MVSVFGVDFYFGEGRESGVYLEVGDEEWTVFGTDREHVAVVLARSPKCGVEGFRGCGGYGRLCRGCNGRGHRWL